MSSTHVGTTRANMHTNASGKRCAVIWCVHLHVCAISIKTAVGSRDFALQCTKMIRFELNVAGASTTSFSSAPHHFGPITSTAQTVRIRYVCVHFCFPWHQFAAHTNRFAKYTCNIRAYNVIWSSDTSFLATICNSVTLNGKFAWKRMPIQSNRIESMRCDYDVFFGVYILFLHSISVRFQSWITFQFYAHLYMAFTSHARVQHHKFHYTVKHQQQLFINKWSD